MSFLNSITAEQVQQDQNSEYSVTDTPSVKRFKTMWSIDDRLASNPTMRFNQGPAAFIEMMAETGTPIMDVYSMPKGLGLFLERRFLPYFGVTHTKFSPLEVVVEHIWRCLDWQEPYFFMVDMPVQLTDENLINTYKIKKCGSVLDPEKIEVFRGQPNWKFPHYYAADKFMSHEVTKSVIAGNLHYTPDGTRRLIKEDVYAKLSEILWANVKYLEGLVEEWMEHYFDDLIFSGRAHDAQMVNEINHAKEYDFEYWKAVAIGTFMWLKSPHGLKYLVENHPLYATIMEWSEERQLIVFRPEAQGLAVADGWSIYCGEELIIEQAKPAGTCAVYQQSLHCTKILNLTDFGNKVCYCGKDLDYEDHYGSNSGHWTEECRKYRQDHPPRMDFISYGAASNIMAGRPMDTPCDRHKCPNTKCKGHAGHFMRIRALTEQRTKMLTMGASH